MADRDVKIGIVATADVAPVEHASKALDGVGESGEQARSKIDGTNRSVDQAANNMRGMGSASETSAEALAGVGAAAADVGEKTSGAGKALVNGQQAMSALGAASAASSGSITGVASALGQLAPKLQGLQAALPVVGLALAAFTAWKKVIDTLADSARGMRIALMASIDAQISNALDRSSTAYGRMREEIDRAAESRRTLSSLEAAAAAAQSRERRAEIEAARAKEKSQLKPDDAAAARRIDARYDARLSIEDDRDSADKANRAVDELKAEQIAIQQAESDILARMQAVMEAGAAERKRMFSLVEKSNAEMDKRDNGIIGTAVKFYAGPEARYLERGREKVEREYGPTTKESGDRLEKISGELDTLRKQLADTREKIQGIEKTREIIRADINTGRHETERRGYERQGAADAARDPAVTAEMDSLRAAAEKSKSAAANLAENARNNDGRMAEALSAMAAAEESKSAAIIAKLEALSDASRRMSERIASIPTS